ncbi:hypothetical protein DBR11_19420 [Pedobacter sp. HMWF019]|nr:hypothetical protein DBR11_19420 [Pedobacter sp. HMWF019]
MVGLGGFLEVLTGSHVLNPVLIQEDFSLIEKLLIKYFRNFFNHKSNTRLLKFYEIPAKKKWLVLAILMP